MKFMFFIYIPLVHSALHTFKTTYTSLNGQTVAEVPQIYSVSTLDGWQIDYYDSDTGKVIPRQDWMKEFASGDKWKKYTEIRERVQETNKQFTQPDGVYMCERVYGCKWDDETEESHGFDEYMISYDGQNFISLDLKENRYTAHVQKAEPTVQKRNNDSEQLDFLKQYYTHDCIYWLKELLTLSKATVKKTGIDSELPGQNLTEQLQKNVTVDDTKSDGSASDDLKIKLAIVSLTSLVVIVLIFMYILWKNGNKLKDHCKNFMSYQVVYSPSADEIAQIQITPKENQTETETKDF